MREMMRRTLSLTLALAASLVLAAGISVAGASAKFASTEEVADSADLVVSFEEKGMKRFQSVEYQLAATATSMACWGGPGGQCAGTLYDSLSATAALTPDAKGDVSGTLTLDIPASPVIPCPCGPGTFQVEYTDVSLTNLTTGHVYRLDSVYRAWQIEATAR